VPNGVHTVVNPKKAPNADPPMRSRPTKPQSFQLPKCHHTMLPLRESRNLPVQPGPTGRIVKVNLTIRPVGGRVAGGHARRVTDLGARVAR